MTDFEQARLEALRSLDLLNTPPSESFDRITRMASQLFQLPMAAVSLTDHDRQWFKSRVGLDHQQIPREGAPCSHCAGSRDVLILPDLLADPRYAGTPLAASGIRFYAGAPLVTRDGFGLGAMCVVGVEPRAVTEQEVSGLKDLAAMVMAQIELQHAFGRIDPVSGLPNRNQFVEDLEDLARDHPGEWRAAVLVDLIGQAQMSDGLRVMGPSYIDDLVKSSTRYLRTALPAGTKVYQLGPSQFGYLLDDARPAAIRASTDAVQLHLETVVQAHGIPVGVEAALGVAPFRLGDVPARDVLRSAHSAAQDARRSESGVGVYSADLDDAHRRRFTIMSDIAAALASPDQLTLVYQPRVDLKSGFCVGAEALLRWRHPTLGHISPGEFIPLVEQTALVGEVTDWVIGTALAQAEAWRRADIELTVSVNVSAANLDDPDFARNLVERLQDYGLPPETVELELTETALIGNGRRVAEQLEAISDAGIPIAIDDFGTGYSSLSYLQQIPARIVKIDRSFMVDLCLDPRAYTLVKAMVAMARDLGFRVVAEGVETAEAYAMLKTLNCDEAQGYYIARPLAAADFEHWLRQEMHVAPGGETLRLSA